MVFQGSTLEQSVPIKHLGNKKCSLFIIEKVPAQGELWAEASPGGMMLSRTPNPMFRDFSRGEQCLCFQNFNSSLKYFNVGTPGLAVHMQNLRGGFCFSEFRKILLLKLCWLRATGIDKLSRNSSPYSCHSHLCFYHILQGWFTPRINRNNSHCQLPGTTVFANKWVSAIAECRVVWMEKGKFKISRYDEC